MKNIMLKVVFFCYVMTLLGCMRFTQEDYDRQERKYERDRQAQEQNAKESVYIKW